MPEPSVPEIPRDAPAAPPPASGATGGAQPAMPPPGANQLTPDEQMARFERELKEQDWGHQPC
ncbi:MAG TPA: hypothetical protein VG936_11615 [Lacunisphaera sp.]|nr:hypothetical protein [Lacunisphaera sp.]